MQRFPVVTLLCLLTAAAQSACGGQNQPPAHAASRDSAATVSELVAVAESLHSLELKGAALAFGDPSGEGEGDEQLRHTAFQSSVALLRRAVQQQPSDARAWLRLGQALAARSYRGFGEWDSTDARESVQALERARTIFAPSDPLWTQLNETLARQRKVVESLRQR